MTNTHYLPPPSVAPLCAPTENDTLYMHRVIQGQVSDNNTYASGGISGHAGLFSNVNDLAIFMHRIMFAQEVKITIFSTSKNDQFLNRTTVSLFIKEYNHTQSSRALGWNTNDPGVFGTFVKYEVDHIRFWLELNLWKYVFNYIPTHWIFRNTIMWRS